MKTITPVIAIVLLLAAAPAAVAETFELTPFIGYRVGGSLTDYYSGASFSLDDSESYGLFLDFATDPFGEFQIELYWSHQETTLNIRGVPADSYDVKVDYLHVGGLRFLGDDDKVRPYLVGSLGATRLNPEDSSIGSTTRFSAGLGVGVKFMPSEHIGIRLEGRGLATFVSSYGAVGCGYPGCGVSWGGTVFWQGDFTAGIVIAF